ncbi:rho guanine nucleotide exchange factor 10-like protein [Trichonephila clavata]|uniref:Rho guanine nucleotide exchange factor 10-like protein n=1 Tax=Trichonephila clavata TaxID=2740835 RepID=A0A8X6HRV0_TRICU|nr:rho guanine nucleotide exchange factor 10-like protein [Trichonephila clavata]
MGGVNLVDQTANVYELDRKSCKWWEKVFFRLLMSAVVNSWIAYCGPKHRKTPLLDFIVPLAEALMNSGKLNAQYQRRRGTIGPTKTSRSLLNVGDHLQQQQKTRRRAVNVHDKRRNRTLKIMSRCVMSHCALIVSNHTIHN